MGAPERRSEDAEIEAALTVGEYDKALRLMMQVHGEDVFRYALAMTRDKGLAEEIRAEVFANACDDLRQLKEPSAFLNWLLRITRNRSIDALKSQSRQRHRHAAELNDDIVDDDFEHSPEGMNEVLDRQKRAQMLAECVAKLRPKYRSAVLLRYFQGLSYDEVAEITGERAGTAQRRVSRAFPILERCMRAKGGSK